jgi:hypothetical protein
MLIKFTYSRLLGLQMHLMQLLAVKAYEPFGTIKLSLYQFRFADEHAA